MKAAFVWNVWNRLVRKLPIIGRLKEKADRLAQLELALNQRQVELELYRATFTSNAQQLRLRARNSVDEAPWRHPFLGEANIKRFRAYSEGVWQFAREHERTRTKPLKIAFSVNTAQNMYNWSRLAAKHGAEAALYLYPWDTYTLTRPEWEEFDGDYADVSDAEGFLKANPDLKPVLPCHRIPIEGNELMVARQAFLEGMRKPLLDLLATSPGVRHEALWAYEGFAAYYRWAKALANYDVVYAAAMPFPAYASGRPYCAFSVGGDLIYDAGRGDHYGQAVSMAFGGARFLMLSNPHPLGHCRRLGLTNAVYLPYPIDDGRYSPGEGQSRMEWHARYGPGVFVLTTARLDRKFKGYGEEFLKSLVTVAKRRPQVRYVFLQWGEDATAFRDQVRQYGMEEHFIILSPVGKKRLIDYYRSCDIVLDHFVFGYYGATALEAAAIGKPVVMKLRTEHYAPLYAGDTMPAFNASSPQEIGEALTRLTDSEELRARSGSEMRQWLIRHHGEARTVPLMLALLRITAERVSLPKDLVNPLLDADSEAEQAYHTACLRAIDAPK